MKIKCEIETSIVHVLTVRAVNKKTDSNEVFKYISGTERVYLFKETALHEWEEVVAPTLRKSQTEEYWKERSFETCLENLFHSSQSIWCYDGELLSFQVTLATRNVRGQEEPEL